ncbi:CLUMA_CG004967, isoform A [Clunio marinus]|uniref:CLUMA_CG004967, isoform A n=1 Tax=Clunio marinus TaxID=568069 RepID=A0A1J1HYU1_9DIPT|nr:CLUMA_CG004967, isoform A [Clunio marinus]
MDHKTCVAKNSVGGKLTGISVNGIGLIFVVTFILTWNTSSVSLSIDNGIGQFLLFGVTVEDGIIIELVYHINKPIKLFSLDDIGVVTFLSFKLSTSN